MKIGKIKWSIEASRNRSQILILPQTTFLVACCAKIAATQFFHGKIHLLKTWNFNSQIEIVQTEELNLIQQQVVHIRQWANFKLSTPYSNCYWNAITWILINTFFFLLQLKNLWKCNIFRAWAYNRLVFLLNFIVLPIKWNVI